MTIRYSDLIVYHDPEKQIRVAKFSINNDDGVGSPVELVTHGLHGLNDGAEFDEWVTDVRIYLNGCIRSNNMPTQEKFDSYLAFVSEENPS